MGCTPVFDIFASAAATAQLLTTSYAASTFGGSSGYHRVSDFTSMTCYVTVGGTVATSLEWRLVSTPGTGTFSDMGTEVASGVVLHQELVEGITDDTGAPSTGLTQMVHIDLMRLGCDLLAMQWKRTGGDATTSVLVQAQMKV